MTATSKRKRVLIIGHSSKPGVSEMVKRVTPWLEQRCEVCGVHLDNDAPLDASGCDFVLVFGGDGTMLSAARRLQGAAAPAVGINLGRMGFLTEIGPDAFEEKIERVLAGEGTVSERMMLECCVRKPDGECKGPFTALNDVVIARGSLSQAIDFEIWINGERVSQYQGDGLIVSTPTGSTGYNLSAGGPVVSPGVGALVLTPICPHSVTNRPVVIGPDDVVEIRMPREAREAILTADGQVHEPLGDDAVVEIQRSERVFRMLELGSGGQYATLRDKLHWGRSVKLQD